MKQYLKETFPKDGKNKYRYIAIVLIVVYVSFAIPPLNAFEDTIILFVAPMLWWLIYKLVPRPE